MKICFVCLGNICRSPMAEFVLKSMAPSDWQIESRATSSWEHGNPIHKGTQKVLSQKGIAWDSEKSSQQISEEDFRYFDKIYAMDSSNLENLYAMSSFIVESEGKIEKLLSQDVPDPWYTGDFEETFRLVEEACKNIMSENLT